MAFSAIVAVVGLSGRGATRCSGDICCRGFDVTCARRPRRAASTTPLGGTTSGPCRSYRNAGLGRRARSRERSDLLRPITSLVPSMSLRNGTINRHRLFACPAVEYGRRGSRWEPRVFSEAKPINPKQPDPPSPAAPRRLIDTVDYIISVSGGGYTAGARLLATQPADKASATKPADNASGRPLLSERFEQGSAEFDHFVGAQAIRLTGSCTGQCFGGGLKNSIASLGMLFTVPAILGWAFGYLLAFPILVRDLRPGVSLVANQITHNTKCRGAVAALADHHASWGAVGSFVILAVVSTMFAIGVEWLLGGISQ